MKGGPEYDARNYCMPPFFPVFEALEVHKHHILIRKHTSAHLPYSDFNVTSLVAYNTEGASAVCVHNDNLIIRLADYQSKQPLLSFMGTSRINETIEDLLLHTKNEHLPPVLKLVPEVTATMADPSRFSIEEDRDNHDYILSIASLINMKGSRLKPYRNLVTRFHKTCRAETRPLDLQDPHTQNALNSLFLRWVRQKGIDFAEAKNEYTALNRALHTHPYCELMGIGVFVDGTLMGFSIFEILQNGHSMLHFEKADTKTCVGIYQYLMYQTACFLQKHGCVFLNYQQDLGIPGLRKAKMSFGEPAHLKKFSITWRNN